MVVITDSSPSKIIFLRTSDGNQFGTFAIQDCSFNKNMMQLALSDQPASSSTYKIYASYNYYPIPSGNSAGFMVLNFEVNIIMNPGIRTLVKWKLKSFLTTAFDITIGIV